LSLSHPAIGASPGLRWLAARVWGLEHAFERARARGRAEDDTRIRIFFVLALFAAGFIALGVGATRAALFSNMGERSAYAWGDGGARADIVDRNGALLAADLLHYGLYVDPREVWDVAETRRALRRALPAVEARRLEKVLHGGRRTFLAGGLTPVEKDRIHDLGLPGLSFEPEQRRVYPLGPTASHLIGFSDSGGAGLAGAEFAFDDVIRTGAAKHQPQALSIDLRVQGALEDEVIKAAQSFQAKGAVGIVTNVQTGEVLGLVSYPNYDPNRASKTDANQLLNRAGSQVFEMGSIFKVFTLAMGLDSGTANLNSTFDARVPVRIGNQVIHDYHAVSRVMSLSDIFVHSSNIGTTKLALQAGAPTVTRYFKAFGLFDPTPIEMQESARPILPRQWNDNAVASASFGHAMSVSPLAVAAGMGSVLNGGRYVPLTIRPVKAGARPEGKRVLSETTSQTMLQLMRLNVVHGTGGKADAPGLRVGGKTGSAEKVVDGRYARTTLVSSFAAVFPTDGPVTADRYFVLVLMDEPKGNAESFGFATGGWTAAPATGRVIDRIAPFLNVKRHLSDPTDKNGDISPTLLNGDER
jgi:cell division protein FtsI (penicillin-binding protein 3)